ncbi:PREDICTED: protein unzipped isoform X1 [Trachymyrmex cornetzi]|uniref:protein unzipped isoform X1 n=2 Tax=Trachymyrmex cornetzi TaxID=471704 RepID=UPI00084F37F6|nr:PREDICTED: protein unzipped isoform X1 [Trachymyrmex cornetzi]
MMLRQKNYLALGVLGCILLLSATTADNSVHILSKYGHQTLTSTTLKWLPVAHYNPSDSKQIIIGGSENVPDSQDENYANQAEIKRLVLYVCRAMHSGVWVAGTQKEKEKVCTVTIHGVVQSYEKYELLENVDGAARISWIQWNKYTPPPVGAVYVDKTMLVARHEVPKDLEKPRYTHYIGTLSSPENFGTIVYVNENGDEESAKSGELLVEAEPIRYELGSVKLNWSKRRDIKRVPRILSEATIVNRGAEPANLAEACVYNYKYSVYWGRRHAILNGLSTTITLINGTSLPNITWGTRDDENRTEAYNVLVYLQPGTGVNVTLKANYTDMEVPYSANLISHYEDSTTTSRMISGTRQEETLFDITPEFGPIYFLSNFSLVPTTVPPPTTTTDPPTTTTLMTTTVPTTMKQDSSRTTHRHQTDDSDIDHDENLITPPKKTDISTGMHDNNSPLLLKVETLYGGATSVAFQSSLLTLVIPLLLLLILHKIT